MSEDIRQEFLLNDRSREEVAEFYFRSAKIYALASERAMWLKENIGELNIARGKEWADKYKLASEDCLHRADLLSRYITQ